MTPKALSREIKFRMWGIKDKFMDDTPVVYKGAPCTIDTEGKVVWMPQGDTVLMQYTGLHDKNGKEIYEGDIVTIPQDMAEVFGIKEKKGAVYFTRGCFYAAEDSSASLTNLALYTGKYTGEVIGNIYENPELLTKENN